MTLWAFDQPPEKICMVGQWSGWEWSAGTVPNLDWLHTCRKSRPRTAACHTWSSHVTTTMDFIIIQREAWTKDTRDWWKMHTLTESDLHADGSAKKGDASSVLWPCPIVCAHTGFIQAEHTKCDLKSPDSWANLTPSSPIIELITVADSCATHFINQCFPC